MFKYDIGARVGASADKPTFRGEVNHETGAGKSILWNVLAFVLFIDNFYVHVWYNIIITQWYHQIMPLFWWQNITIVKGWW